MDTTNSSENKQRRVEDRKPEAVIDWGAPGAPAVPVSPIAAASDSLVPAKFVASMRVDAEGVSVFATEEAKRLPYGHYVLCPAGQPAPGAPQFIGAESAAEAAQPAPHLSRRQILDIGARCGLTGKGMDAKLLDFAALVRDAEPQPEVLPAPDVADEPIAPAATSGAPVPPVPAPAPQDDNEPVATVSRNRVDGTLIFEPLGDFYVVDGMKLYATPAVPVNAAPSDGWPEEIYLNAGDDPLGHFEEYDDVSWCDHPQGESDVRYVRAHLARQAQPTERDAVLEEAAKAAEEAEVATMLVRGQTWDDGVLTRENIAAAIRALKSGSTTEGAGS